MIAASASLRAPQPTCSAFRDKKASDKARLRRLKTDLVRIAEKEKSYAKSQARWLKRRHTELQKSVKDAISDFKENVLADDDDWDDGYDFSDDD